MDHVDQIKTKLTDETKNFTLWKSIPKRPTGFSVTSDQAIMKHRRRMPGKDQSLFCPTPEIIDDAILSGEER